MYYNYSYYKGCNKNIHGFCGLLTHGTFFHATVTGYSISTIDCAVCNSPCSKIYGGINYLGNEYYMDICYLPVFTFTYDNGNDKGKGSCLHYDEYTYQYYADALPSLNKTKIGTKDFVLSIYLNNIPDNVKQFYELYFSDVAYCLRTNTNYHLMSLIGLIFLAISGSFIFCYVCVLTCRKQ
jgi:hypothetical protein